MTAPRKPRRRRVKPHVVETPAAPAELVLPAMPDDPAAEWARLGERLLAVNTDKFRQVLGCVRDATDAQEEMEVGFARLATVGETLGPDPVRVTGWGWMQKPQA